MNVPTVSTSAITDITQISAVGGSEVTADGGAEVTARGVCWSTTQNPTIEDNHTEDGTGTGAFVGDLTILTPNTPYYVRAYATNSVGTAYGDEVTFTTLPAGLVCGSSLTINHVTGDDAPVNKTVTYGTVNNIPGEETKCSITSNLGSDHQATDVTDDTEASAGWYRQFNHKQGYKHDGTTRIPNTVWLNNINENSNWLSANDPCGIELGAGWRVPSATEWINVMTANNWVNWNGPWNSDLKLHAAGSLLYNNGYLDSCGYVGLYNSSTHNNVTEAYSMGFDFQSMIVDVAPKTSGFTMRCIKDSLLEVPHFSILFFPIHPIFLVIS